MKSILLKFRYIKINEAEKYLFFLFISLYIMFLFLGLSTLSGNRNIVFLPISAAIDSFTFTALLSLFRGKWKFISLAFPFILLILIYSVIIYYRNFSDFIPPSLYLHNNISDPIVLSYITNSFSLDAPDHYHPILGA